MNDLLLEQDWVKRADCIRQELAQAAFGQRASVYLQSSRATGYSVSALKREVQAANSIERLAANDDSFGEQLRSLGSNAVGEISRLFDTDPELARLKASQAASGRISQSEISRSRHAREEGLPPRTGRVRAREFVEFLAKKGKRWNIRATKKPSYQGALIELVMKDGTTGCAVYFTGSCGALEQVDRRLSMLLFYGWLAVGFETDEVPEIWKRRIGEMEYRKDRIMLFVKSGKGFRLARA